MPQPIVRIIPADQPELVDPLVDMLCRAFDQDAHFNWIVRQDKQRKYAMKQLFRNLLTDWLGARGEVHASADLKAGAILFPPDEWPLPPREQLRTAWDFVRITGWRQALRCARGLAGMDRGKPNERHYFLQTLGVDPAFQHRGYGHALITHLQKRCYESQQPLYLVTSSGDNAGYYTRHGFGVIGTSTLPEGPMIYRLLWRPND